MRGFRGSMDTRSGIQCCDIDLLEVQYSRLNGWPHLVAQPRDATVRAAAFAREDHVCQGYQPDHYRPKLPAASKLDQHSKATTPDFFLSLMPSTKISQKVSGN